MNDAQEPWGQTVQREFTLRPSIDLRHPYSIGLTAHVERVFSALCAELALVIPKPSPTLPIDTNQPVKKGTP